MTTPTKYFHDRSVLLLLIINSVLVIAGVLFVLFHLDASKGSTYIIQCRMCDTAAHEFNGGSAFDMSGFIFFLLITSGFAVFTSRRVYNERRNVALAILVMTSLLAIFAVIVSYSLFSLR
jgi:heme/copper-type cytochrome/quinol oxidase subunit 3